MRRSRPLARYVLPGLILILAALLGVGACRRPDPAPPSPPPEAPAEVSGDLAVTNVTVVDVAAGAARPGRTVVVRGDRVAEVLPADGCRVVGPTKVVDGAGKFLIPGLWDMHAHLIHDALLPSFLRHGVTGVRHMFGYNPAYRYRPPADPAAPPHPRVVAAHHVLDGPDTVFPFPVNLGVVRAADGAAARAGVRELRKRGNDFVKVYSALPREAFLAALDEAKALGMWAGGHVPHAVPVGEASDAGYRTVEHLGGVAFACSSREAQLRQRLLGPGPLEGKGGPGKAARGEVDVERADRATGWREQVEAHEAFDPGKADALFRKFVANGTWHVPTLVTARAMARLGDPGAVDPGVEGGLPEQLRYYWRREFTPGGGVRLPNLGLSATPADLMARAALFRGDVELVRRMHRAGVGLLAGTDAPSPLVVPGLSLHEELELLVEAGLAPAEALRAATLGPARCLGREADLGTVAPGKLADLVLLTADPLADVRNTRSIDRVLVGGRVVGR